MNIVKDYLPEGAVLIRFMVDETWIYNQMTILVIENDIAHIKGWIGKPPTKDHFQALSDHFPQCKYAVWERVKDDGRIVPIKLKLPTPNETPKSTMILNPCK